MRQKPFMPRSLLRPLCQIIPLVLSHTVWPPHNTNCVLNRTSLYLRWLNFVPLRYRIALLSMPRGWQWHGGQLLPRESYLQVFSFPQLCILLSGFIIPLVSAQTQQPDSFVILKNRNCMIVGDDYLTRSRPRRFSRSMTAADLVLICCRGWQQSPSPASTAQCTDNVSGLYPFSYSFWTNTNTQLTACNSLKWDFFFSKL